MKKYSEVTPWPVIFVQSTVNGLVPGCISKELLQEYTGENVHDRESYKKNYNVSHKQPYENLKLPKCNCCQCEKRLAAISMLRNTGLHFVFFFLKRPLFYSVTLSFRHVVQATSPTQLSSSQSKHVYAGGQPAIRLKFQQ